MKNFKFSLAVALILPLLLSFACAKKAIRSEEVGGPTLSRMEPRTAEAAPEGKPGALAGAKPEAPSPDQAALERERKLREESLREQALREKALREEAARREAAAREAAARAAALKDLKLEPIYFEFDQWSIREDQKETMAKNTEWLKANPTVKLRLEGHCDERGTAEYNLALGQKRAEAAKAFLEGLGISSQRMTTVSYGEERPQEGGNNEAAWSKNRRVDFVPVP